MMRTSYRSEQELSHPGLRWKFSMHGLRRLSKAGVTSTVSTSLQSMNAQVTDSGKLHR